MDQHRCPKCKSENIYQDRDFWVCPECSNEWSNQVSRLEENSQSVEDLAVRDANGNILNSGDSVIVIKDLKIKGSSSSVKGGTKIRNIRLTEENDGHNIVCKIDGVGSINLKSEYVRKV